MLRFKCRRVTPDIDQVDDLGDEDRRFVTPVLFAICIVQGGKTQLQVFTFSSTNEVYYFWYVGKGSPEGEDPLSLVLRITQMIKLGNTRLFVIHKTTNDFIYFKRNSNQIKIKTLILPNSANKLDYT